MYNQLDFMQQLEGRPADQVGYGQALAGGGNVDGARETLQAVLEASAEPRVGSLTCTYSFSLGPCKLLPPPRKIWTCRYTSCRKIVMSSQAGK